MRKLNLMLVFISVLAVVAAACSSDSGGDDAAAGSDGGSDGGSIVLYSGRAEDLVQPLIDRFEESSGIDVEVRYGDSAELALLITEEGDRSPADVFLSQSPGAMGFLDEAGLLTDLPDSVLGAVDSAVADDDGRWVGVTGRQRVLVYNPDLVDESELPATIFDLVDPAWNDRIGVAPGNGSFQDFVTAMRATEGDDATQQWLEGLAANNPLAYSGNSAIVAAVGRGEIDAGLVNHYYNVRALEEDPDHSGVNHYFPDGDPGSVLIVTAAAQLAASDQTEAATTFLEYLLSEDAQTYFAEETFEYPLRSGSQPVAQVPSATFGAVGAIDFDELGGGLSGTRDMIASAGLEEG